MKLMFLASGDRVPSCRFRVLQLIPSLRAAGHQCTVAASFPQKYDTLPWLGFRLSRWLKRMVRYGHLLRARAGRYDAIILERELFHDPSWDMEQRFRRAARTLVLDIDDAVFLNFPEKIPRLVEMSDLVIAGNRLLQDWLEPLQANVAIIPTCVDLDVYHVRRSPIASETPVHELGLPSRPGLDRSVGWDSRPDKTAQECHPTVVGTRVPTYRPVVGWMGTTGNVVYLREAAEGLRAAAQRFDFELRVIAGERGELDSLPFDGVNVQFVRWEPDTEATAIQAFDIGLMPLSDDPWSRYKCGLKLLQYMAIGIPGIASPVGVNAEIIEHEKNGFLANSPREWADALSRLLSDQPLRESMGAAARKTVDERYSVQVNLPRWIAAVESAVRGAK